MSKLKKNASACEAPNCDAVAEVAVGARHVCAGHVKEAIKEFDRNSSHALGAVALEAQDQDILAIAAGINPKDVIGRTKPGLHNLPLGPLFQIARAFDDGARKYGAFNGRGNPVLASVYFNAAQRHLSCWMHGEERAADSKIPHLAHAMACLLILMDAAQQGALKDDRPQRNVALDDILEAIAAEARAATSEVTA